MAAAHYQQVRLARSLLVHDHSPRALHFALVLLQPLSMRQFAVSVMRVAL